MKVTHDSMVSKIITYKKTGNDLPISDCKQREKVLRYGIIIAGVSVTGTALFSLKILYFFEQLFWFFNEIRISVNMNQT